MDGKLGGGEREFMLQWGNQRRPRRIKTKVKSEGTGYRKVTPVVASLVSEEGKSRNNVKPQVSSSLEKEERYYTTRGSLGIEESEKVLLDSVRVTVEEGNNKVGGVFWPKLLVALTNKEKEEDFLIMKGCKPSQRPKKRAKYVQKSILLVTPGAWLSDLCLERYEVKEKKNSKKRPRGLRAMGSIDSDSE